MSLTMHGHDIGKYFKDFDIKLHVPSQYRASKNVDEMKTTNLFHLMICGIYFSLLLVFHVRTTEAKT